MVNEKTKKDSTYKHTLVLPKTSFEMRANLVVNEKATIQRWKNIGVYETLRKTRKGSKEFVLHDGPPYANGNIHIGHMLNKVVKDIIIRSHNMIGYNCSFTPGWDCHGLPIEHKVLKDLGSSASSLTKLEIRNMCRSFAESQVASQMNEMKNLLTMGDYDHPYLTMNNNFESNTLGVFASMVKGKLVFRQKKPVHWSVDNKTALAESELEYKDREDTSCFVRFHVEDSNFDLLIWTTTPWSLPANVAIAINPYFKYVLVELEGKRTVVAENRLADVCKAKGLEVPVILEYFNNIPNTGNHPERKAHQLDFLKYTHPFMTKRNSNEFQVVPADFVTEDTGTGLVHIAPGHGSDDFKLGTDLGFDPYCPVTSNGTYDNSVVDWLKGIHVWKANQLIIDKLNESGNLYSSAKFKHSYPHDWRSKTPVIVRATDQWFVGMDEWVTGASDEVRLRESALKELDNINFLPSHGKNRLNGMLETRPDWCISRQRCWGLPIPVFYFNSNEYLLTEQSVLAVSKVFEKNGSNAWFEMTVDELLSEYNPMTDPDAPNWAKDESCLMSLVKGTDTFDVWFESGSSWNTVLGNKQADLYLEGNDQHRGWFQHSLLASMAVNKQSPFKTVFTHGFVVDKDSNKMSKSGSNAIDVSKMVNKFGADVCRWWVSSINAESDIKASEDFFVAASEEYRKVRNTLKFLLSFEIDFNFGEKYFWSEKDANSLDAYIHNRANDVNKEIVKAYSEFRIKDVSRLIYNFCNDTLSSKYFVMLKDRMYCDMPSSNRRVRALSVLSEFALYLMNWLAPICPHTADEAYLSLTKDDKYSIHLNTFLKFDDVQENHNWLAVFGELSDWNKAIEETGKNPLDLKLTVKKHQGHYDVSQFDKDDLTDLCGVSQFVVGTSLQVEELTDDKCERSRKRDGTVKLREDGGMLSDRDFEAVESFKGINNHANISK